MNLDYRLHSLSTDPNRYDLICFLKQIPHTLLRWYTRIEERHLLLEMSDEILRDAGLSRDQVRREATKPFWRD
jgi:uncharacterized protein YjiS (DUF1127 family)